MSRQLRRQPNANHGPLWGRFVLGFFLAMLTLSAWAQVAVPELSRRITDLTATLSAGQIAALESKLAAFEAQKGSQIAVLIVPTTQPEDIAQFGIRVAEQWKIGRQKIDDGVILIVAKDDRKFRIEVGYGLEGVIPDAIAKRVIAETITPYFKAGDFNGGIDAGVQQLIKLIEGEPLPPPTKQNGGGEESFVLLVFGGVIAGWLLSLMMGRPAAGGVAALGSGVVGALLLGLTPIVLLAAVFVFAGVASGFRSGGGWSSGGGGGGFGGGGGSWGGGGGGFGGGGASGSW